MSLAEPDNMIERPSDPIDDLVVVPRRHYGIWIGMVVALLFAFVIIRALATNPAFAWDVAAGYLFHPSIMRGLAKTLLLTVVIMAAAIVVGTIIAIMRVSPSLVLQSFASAYVWFFRGVPALIQLIFWFNLSLLFRTFSLSLPWIGPVFSVNTNDFMTPFVSAVVALSLCEAGYLAEIIRAGIKSVPSGQSEAASGLGLSYGQILRRIILPQAMRFIVPPTGNEAISLLKMTSLVTFIAVDDLFYTAQSIYARTFETIPLLIVVAFWYLFVVTVMSIGQHFLERYYGRSDKLDESPFARLIRLAFAPRRVGVLP
ncbi:amino acid ABC transporter permease [Kaistia dalseonensis]|uniref:Polar amino acid transport system permease protein n=1 Tax=Kaistia dalseonensis TaxID=410840 RepID=A0ABU0H761_9HYPH|nr:amino acid ABC transporter permease [Kaistia dalseonensis]MCX5495545.1 amino acid ABC transporter permease [Kaistia dalseonensis]MDQ0438137.1 polar amino acid transport system permease protein [Kaistia dalseonensis]